MPAYAQTILQLLNQLSRCDHSTADCERVATAHDLAAGIFTARFRGSGKPFLAHLVGTASVAARLREPVDLVLAGLLHAAYTHGDWGPRKSDSTEDARTEVRRAIGDRSEAIIRRWRHRTDAGCDSRVRASPSGHLDCPVILLRLANEVDDYQDRAALYMANTADAERLLRLGETFIGLAAALGHPVLVADFEELIADTEADTVPRSLKRRPAKSYSLVPRSCSRRSRLSWRRFVRFGT